VHFISAVVGRESESMPFNLLRPVLRLLTSATPGETMLVGG